MFMRLIDHLKNVKKTVPEFADDIGEPENTVRKIVYQQRQPSLPLAVKIAAATGGAVREADLVLSKGASA
jgi:plasmid maintenance system antidote protein VapI